MSEPPEAEPPPGLRLVVMGVSGSGKTLIGAALARTLGGRFVEGDDLHPPVNRAKMAAGTPLTDEDRWPWLDVVAAALRDAAPPAVAACSALRRAYRDRLRAGVPGLLFLHLDGPREEVAARLAARRGHFMPPALLQSQYEALEPLGADEAGVAVENRGEPEAVARAAVQALVAASSARRFPA